MNDQESIDRRNLVRIIKALERSVSSPIWNLEGDRSKFTTWIKAKAALENVKYARKLTNRVEDMDPEAESDYYFSIREKLNMTENFFNEVEKNLAPKPRHIEPMLPHVPPPSLPPSGVASPETPEESTPLSPQNGHLGPPESELIPSGSIADKIPELIPSSPRPGLATRSTSTALPWRDSDAASLFSRATTSTQPTTSNKGSLNTESLHQDLTTQLSQMASQLKANAMHFSSSLEKDALVLAGADTKLQSNYDSMMKEKGRLDIHSKKSRGTTWLTVFAIISVLIGFFIMVYIIRFTKMVPLPS